MSDGQFEPTSVELVLLGNAIIGLEATCDEALLRRVTEMTDVTRAGSHLVEADRLDEICRDVARFSTILPQPGGSAANTAAGLSALGVATEFIGVVGADPLGDMFRADFENRGVRFRTAAAISHPTGRCLVLVSPDAERTMLCHLGAASCLDVSYVRTDAVSSAKMTFVEGYLWQSERSKAAAEMAITITRCASRSVALSLSDVACVRANSSEFLRLIQDGYIDIVFGNKAEFMELVQKKDLTSVIGYLVTLHSTAAFAVTLGARGSVVIKGGHAHGIPAYPARRVVDTTGAGDAFAAGFMHGVLSRHDLVTCAQNGSFCAAKIVSQLGTRPSKSVKHEMRQLKKKLADP